MSSSHRQSSASSERTLTKPSAFRRTKPKCLRDLHEATIINPNEELSRYIMNLRDTAKMAFVGLSTNRIRSALTILGIVIGITSIIIVMSLGQSAQNLIVGQVESLGSTNIFVIPGKQPEGFDGGASTILQDSLREKDIQDLKRKENVPNATNVMGMVFSPVVASYGSETKSTMVLGGSPAVADLWKLEIGQGQAISDEDVSQKDSVTVLGSKIAEDLFGLANPVGERIKIKDRYYRVIGVLAEKGQSPFVNFDDSILAPVSTVQQYIMGVKYYQRVVVVADTVENIPNVVSDIKAVLRSNHDITDPDKDDFFVQTQADLADTVGTITDILTILLGSVAAISLLVGGIGIMNIMLVSVTERTREIGLRKALGATNKDILVQFLTEAVILTVSGGIVGIILGTLFGAGATFAINRFTSIGFPFSFSVLGAVLGVGVSSVIGFVFGIFPARRAAKKSPIEALRYE